jgi:flagellar hook assembly protein FlgD
VLGAAAQVKAQVLDAGGLVVATVLAEQRAAGVNAFSWSAAALPDGRYRLVLTATTAGRSVRKTADVVVDRTLTELQATVLALSPNGDGVDDTTTVGFPLAQSVPLRVQVMQAGIVRTTLFEGTLGPGPQSIAWDGSAAGATLPDGAYTLAFTVSDALGDVTLSLPVTIDNTPPVLTIVDPKHLVFTLSEPATLTVVVNGQTRIVTGEPSGRFTVPFAGTVSSVSAQAQDFAGNLSTTVTG